MFNRTQDQGGSRGPTVDIHGVFRGLDAATQRGYCVRGEVLKWPQRFIHFVWIVGLSCLIIQGCATGSVKDYDRAEYASYLAHMPRSILVLPPENETIEVMAPYIYLSTVTRSLAERGYYVYPVAVIDTLMKENGVPIPAEMAQISLKKIKEVINPDAVLYLTIIQWGTKYQVIDTRTIVHIQGRLVDTETGDVLWKGEQSVVQDTNEDHHSSIGEMLGRALVNKITASFFNPCRDLSYEANDKLFNDPQKGLLIGQRHPGFSEEQHRLKQKQVQDEQ